MKMLLVPVVLSSVLPFACGANFQAPGLQVPASAAAHRDTVEGMFTTSYDDYLRFAKGHDDVTPISKGFSDPLGGFGSSLADALDTMLVMGLTGRFNDALDLVAKIDFSRSHTGDPISFFETTIRFVGGFLSAFELSGQQHQILVQKAKQVADKLFFGFAGRNVIPFNMINFRNNTPVRGTTNTAQAGTMILEYNRLTQYTGNQNYLNKALAAMNHIAGLRDPLPGLPAMGLDPVSGRFIGEYVTWGSGTDSYLEYLLKYPRLTNTNQIFINEWALAVDTSIKRLIRTSTVGDFTYLANWDTGKIIHISSHLACFHAGNWMLGGRMLNNDTIFNLGLKLNDGCWNTYASTATGIGPEVFAFISRDGEFNGGTRPTRAQLAFYQQHGFYITTSDYINRPEVLESNFYAWRATGDTKYLDRAAAAVNSFNTFLKAPAGFKGLNDVNNRRSTGIDDQPSFWLAEVLKYLYLTFDDPSHISLDDYVFNTECHPFKIPTAKATFSTPPIPTDSPTFTASSGTFPGPSPNPMLPVQLKDALHIPGAV